MAEGDLQTGMQGSQNMGAGDNGQNGTQNAALSGAQGVTQGFDQSISQDAQPQVHNMTVQIDDPEVDEVAHKVEEETLEVIEDKAPQAPKEVEQIESHDMNKAIDKINASLKEKAVSENAKAIGIPYINISQMPINPDMFELLEGQTMKDAHVIPFFRIGKRLRVAVAFPDKPETIKVLDGLKERHFELNVNLASDSGIESVLDRYLKQPQRQKVEVHDNEVNEEKLKAYEQEIQNLTNAADKLRTMPAEEAINLLNVGAIKTGASDIHFQPEDGFCQVRFRIDGMMQDIMQLEPKVYENLANQLKFKAKLKLNINSEPQDGRFFFLINNEKIDLRVSVIPTEYGESVVMRILDSRKGFLSLEELGFSDFNYTILKKITELSVGLILVTGPTGSGKTTSLYALLEELNDEEVKIITLEDPIEYHLKGVTQSQINEKRGYSFSSGLRAVLRQDPNVVMIGEIRDSDTANTTCQAALTGHLVLSTLHTNSAVESIPRMTNIGVPEFMLAPALKCIIAQRLVRVLCDNCKREDELTEKEHHFIKEHLAQIKAQHPNYEIEIPTHLQKPVGCEKCSHTGYKGQTQIAEILVMDEELKDMILNNKSEGEIQARAQEKGMLTMVQDGVIKVVRGITTLEEIFRVTNR